MFVHPALRIAVFGLFLCVSHGTAGATGNNHPQAAGNVCQHAVQTAENLAKIPQHLLHAIAMVESGISVAPGQPRVPWPWTVMSQGKGRYFKNRAAAVKVVRELLQQGIYNIDVGCMQVNLRYHGMAFQSLEEAFDPVVNVAYAAGFLKKLNRRHGNWDDAVKHYHSGTPARHKPYRIKVRAELIALKKTGAPMTGAAQAQLARHLANAKSPPANRPSTSSPNKPAGRIARAQSTSGQNSAQNPASQSARASGYLKLAQWPPQSYKSQQQAEFNARARVFYPPPATPAEDTPSQ